MTRLVSCLTLALLAATLTGCPSRDRPVAPPASPAATGPEWKEFTHEKGRFAVLLPGPAQEQVTESQTAVGPMTYTINVVELKDQGKKFAVVFADYPPGANYGDEELAHKVISAVIAGNIRSRKGEVRNKSRIKLGNHYGQEGLIDFPDGQGQRLLRVYLVGNRLYQLASDWSGGAASADAEKFLNSFRLTETAPGKAASLTDARRGFKTKLTRRGGEKEPLDEPPAGVLRIVRYDSPVGKLGAYLTPAPKDGKKHPAIIWITGGDCNSIDQGCWKEGPPANDQSASAFRKAGIVLMFPSLRGGNDNPGDKEGFLGEVDDVLAAREYLAGQPFVDPERIYLGGHSTGGTLVLLVAECSDRFRAVFSFGPANEVAGYGPEYLPFDTSNPRELELRSPGRWLGSIRSPVFVFEGMVQGNLDSLQAMARASTNPKARFLPVQGANHFSLLAPVTRLIAEKILRDDGAETRLAFTEAEVNQRIKN
jgi:acetyl esterase/lipase